MQAMWVFPGAASVRHVRARPTMRFAYTTVMTVMSRLVDKGPLPRWRDGHRYMYEATVANPVQLAGRQVIRRFGDAVVGRLPERGESGS